MQGQALGGGMRAMQVHDGICVGALVHAGMHHHWSNGRLCILRGGVMNDCYIWPALAALGQNYKLSAVP